MTTSKKRKTARRGNGEGSIFQRADGRWVGRVTVGFGADGKRRQKTVYGTTKAEAQAKLTRLQGQKMDGTLGDAGKMTVADFLTRWLEDTARTTVRASTYDCYESLIRLHVIPHIGGVKLDRLKAIHVTGLYSALERENKSPRMRQLVHGVLRRALGNAVKVKLITSNPVAAVDRPHYNKPEINPLTAEQARTLLTAAQGNRLEALYVLALSTGCRQGELLGLQWRDVDLADGFISIRHTLRIRKGEPALLAPKTKKSRRKIDLPEIAVDAVHDHRRLMLAEGFAASEYVFVSRTGKPICKSQFRRGAFKALLKAARKADPSFPEIRFHDLRHTAATLMLLEGVHPKVVQERLGHSQIGITLDVYSHVLPSMQQDAASKIGGVLTRRA